MENDRPSLRKSLDELPSSRRSSLSASDNRASTVRQRELQEIVNEKQRRKSGETSQYSVSKDMASVQEALRQNYPNLSISKHSNLDGWADAFWQQHMRGLKLVDLLRQLLCSSPAGKGSLADITIYLFREASDKAFRIKLELRPAPDPESTKEATPFFSANYAYVENQHGELDVKLETIDAAKAPKGSAGQFINTLLDNFEELRVQEIHLDASGIGSGRDGVFVWARYGFVPEPEAWAYMLQRGRSAIKKHKKADWYKEVKALLGKKASPDTIRHLVYLSWRYRDDELTKLLNEMLGANDAWKGSLSLTKKSDREWIRAYATQGSKDPDAYVDWLPNAPESEKTDCIIS